MLGADTRLLLGETFKAVSLRHLHDNKSRYEDRTFLTADLSGNRVVSSSPASLSSMGAELTTYKPSKLFELQTSVGSLIADERSDVVIGSRLAMERSYPLKVRNSRGMYVPVYIGGNIHKIKVDKVEQVLPSVSPLVFEMSVDQDNRNWWYVVLQSGIIVRVKDRAA